MGNVSCYANLYMTLLILVFCYAYTKYDYIKILPSTRQTKFYDFLKILYDGYANSYLTFICIFRGPINESVLELILG